MINYIDLYKKIQPHRVTKDEDMPWAYQRANPKGRPLHDDWFMLKSTPRMSTAYKVPYPFKKIAGNQKSIWVPYQAEYPLHPEAEIRQLPWWSGSQTLIIPHIEVYEHIAKPGEWSEQAAWLDGEWVPCFYTKTSMIFGTKVKRCWGLKPDTTPGDWIAWMPEFVLEFGTKGE